MEQSYPGRDLVQQQLPANAEAEVFGVHLSAQLHLLGINRRSSIKQKYSDGKQDFLDGITVEYKDWWFNVRPSNTEPLLRLTIEANTTEILEQKQKELTNIIV